MNSYRCIGHGPRRKKRGANRKKFASCPFRVIPVAQNAGGVSKKNRIYFQKSPFSQQGQLKPYEALDTAFFVTPSRKWVDMTLYRRLVLKGITYITGDFIYVYKKSIGQKHDAHYKQPKLPQWSDYWVAKILAIRAADKFHVYARVCWMYSPNDIGNKKLASERRPYHNLELIASNHMDIINIYSIAAKAKICYRGALDDTFKGEYYWREALNIQTGELLVVT